MRQVMKPTNTSWFKALLIDNNTVIGGIARESGRYFGNSNVTAKELCELYRVAEDDASPVPTRVDYMLSPEMTLEMLDND